MTEIWASPDGPYLVRGGLPLIWRRPVRTEHGEPIAWATGDQLDTGKPGRPYALCRCGQSGNKPFCDGSHNASGVDFTDGDCADRYADRYADRADEYPGPGLVVRDDRSLCSRAGFCGTRTTDVWKLLPESAGTEARSLLLAMIERCPSGALTYSVDGVGQIEPRLPVEVAIEPDGPLIVTGGVNIRRSDGTTLEIRNRVALCRCGVSKNKPLCDGSHVEAGFRDLPPPE